MASPRVAISICHHVDNEITIMISGARSNRIWANPLCHSRLSLTWKLAVHVHGCEKQGNHYFSRAKASEMLKVLLAMRYGRRGLRGRELISTFRRYLAFVMGKWCNTIKSKDTSGPR